MEPCHTLLKICHLYSFVSLIHIVVNVPRWISSNKIYSLLRQQGSSPITKQHDGMLSGARHHTAQLVHVYEIRRFASLFGEASLAIIIYIYICNELNRHQESSLTFNPTYVFFPTPRLLCFSSFLGYIGVTARPICCPSGRSSSLNLNQHPSAWSGSLNKRIPGISGRWVKLLRVFCSVLPKVISLM